MAGAMAAGTSKALAEVMGGAELATKMDIASLRTERKSDIELLRRDIVIKFGSMLVISVGVLPAAIRYLPPHP